jgi:signal transduction histidine kinase
MKLNTRLTVVVTAILIITSFVTSTQAVLSMRHEKLATVNSVLNNIVKQLNISKEDDISLALYLAGNSPIPVSLAYITDSKEISYLLENGNLEFKIPAKKDFLTGTVKPIEIANTYQRYFPINDSEYLSFYISISDINSEISRSLRSILFFDLLAVFLSSLLVFLLFRRDSKLNSAAKGMQEFIGDASHELKTPLTVIRGYSELLSNSPEQIEKYAKRINEESLRMNKIIDQLLKIAALGEGRSEQPVTIDISEYLKSHIEDLLVLQPSRQVTYISKPLEIKAPYDLVDTLLANVITNARVHSPESAPIQISIDGKTVTIEDGGPGLKEIPDKPFKRFDTSRSRETGGSGLGMSLIQKSAKGLGAKLTFAKSELGGLKVELQFK